MNTTIKVKGSKIFVIAKDGPYSDKKLCKLEDTENGFQVKFYSHDSILQDKYLSLDYDEAEYLLEALHFNLGTENE